MLVASDNFKRNVSQISINIYNYRSSGLKAPANAGSVPDGFAMCNCLITQTLWHLLLMLTLTRVAEEHLLHRVTKVFCKEETS